MDKIVQFRVNIDDLSTEKYNSFIESLDRKFLSTALFDHLCVDLQRNNNTSNVEQINNKLLTFIEDKNKSNEIISIMDISDSLLNKIYQYLDAKSYSRFQTCNRSLFIIARNPSHNQYNNLRHYLHNCKQNHVYVDIEQFKRVKYISVSAKELRDAIQHQFRFSCADWLGLEFISDESPVALVIEAAIQNVIDLTNISTLYIPSADHSNQMHNLLPHIPNLQFLQFEAVECIRFDSNHKKQVPQLRGFSIFGEDEISMDDESFKSVYALCGSQLQSFHTDFPINKYNKQLFNNLKELCFRIPAGGAESCIKIIKRCKSKLKRVFIKDPCGDDTSFSDELINTLFECERLQCVSFEMWGCFKSPQIVIKAIQRALLIHKKHSFKIKFVCNCEEMDDSEREKLSLDLVLLINSLPFLVSGDFMFIFRDPEWLTFESEELDSLHQHLSVLDPKIFDIKFDRKNRYFVVTNKGCHLCGYSDKWIFTPKYCDCSFVTS